METDNARAGESAPLGSQQREPWRVACRIVGVMPITAIDTRRRLFHALERVFPVRFEPREAGDLTGLDAFVAFPSATSDDADLTASGRFLASSSMRSMEASDASRNPLSSWP